MAGNRSFRDYVADRFYNDMFAAIQKCVEQGSEFSNSLRYREPSEIAIELSDIDVKFVYINDLPGTRIEFDVSVEAELEVYQSDYRYECPNSYSRWLILKCSGDLDCNLNDFEILSIAEYTGKNKHPRPMSDALVPIIKKEQLESVATDFLRRHYPEALIEPMAVDPYVLTEKMGLTIETRQITKDLSVFGQIFFHDCDTEFYDEDKDEMVLTHVSARTIVVDPKVYFQYNFGTVNNTIIHECVHWDLHRKAFELERLYNSSATKIKCQVVGGIKGINSDATDWMEWQANALAPRIQMPYEMFKLKANELIEKYRYELGTDELIDVIELVIDDLAAFFNVSRTAAKIRMIDAGYEEAIGTFTYIDGRYVKPHRFKKGVNAVGDVGGLVGESGAGVIYKNCTVSGTIKADNSSGQVDEPYAGGVIGRESGDVDLYGCTVNATVSSYKDGFAGRYIGGQFDGIDPKYVAMSNNVYFTSLKEAIKAAAYSGYAIYILKDCTFESVEIDMYYKTLIINGYEGLKPKITFSPNCLQSYNGSFLYFRNVELEFENTPNYYETGLSVFSATMCNIYGQYYDCAESITFDNCVFYQQSTISYNACIYKANVSFRNCEFYCNGRCVLIKNNGETKDNPAKIEFSGCEFYSNVSVSTCAAINISTLDGASFDVLINGCYASGFDDQTSIGGVAVIPGLVHLNESGDGILTVKLNGLPIYPAI